MCDWEEGIWVGIERMREGLYNRLLEQLESILSIMETARLSTIRLPWRCKWRSLGGALCDWEESIGVVIEKMRTGRCN